MKILTFILGTMQTNCYFVIDEATGKTIIIDPADKCDKIIAKLNEKNLTAEMILLTHGHFDHMMALYELRRKLNIKTGIHADDAEAIVNPEISYMKQFAEIETPDKPAEILLNDGDIIKSGDNEIRVIHTPGHTMGSVCYVIGDNIITGDTLFRGDIGRYDLYGGDYMQLLKSLKKLSSIDTSEHDYKIFPGHGSSSRLSYEKANNIYLK